jgi:membrane-associated phospholipid phosphatase
MKKTFDFTHVEYVEDDYLSFFVAVSSLFPLIFVIMNASVLLVKRDIYWIYCFFGALGCAALNEVLKSLLREARPLGSHKEGYGMPSNHTQLTFYYLTVFIYFLFRKIEVAKTKRAWIYWLLSGALFVSNLVGYSRVDAGVHSVKQVVVGGFVGVLYGLLLLQSYAILPIKRIVGTSFAHYFYIYDSAHIRNPLQFEHEAYNRKPK